MQKGIIDRFRSLPMSRSAVLVGRTTLRRRLQRDLAGDHGADRAAGRLADPRGHRRRAARRSCCCWSSPTRSAGSWRWVGLMVPSVEVVNNASFIVIMPLTFVSNAFVPLESFSGVLQDLRRVEPGLDGHPGLPRAVRQHRARRAGARLVGDAEPGALHADLGRRHPGDLRPALGPPVPPLHQQVAVPSVSGSPQSIWLGAGRRTAAVDDVDYGQSLSGGAGGSGAGRSAQQRIEARAARRRWRCRPTTTAAPASTVVRPPPPSERWCTPWPAAGGTSRSRRGGHRRPWSRTPDRAPGAHPRAAGRGLAACRARCRVPSYSPTTPASGSIRSGVPTCRPDRSKTGTLHCGRRPTSTHPDAAA